MLSALTVIALITILTACWDKSQFDAIYDSQKLETDSLQRLVSKHYSAGQLDSAIFYASIIAARYDENSPMEQRMVSAHAYNDCGISYFMLGNYPRAYNSFLSAARLGNEDMEVMVNNNIASIYYYFDDKEKALDYLHKAFSGALKTENWNALYSAGLNIMTERFNNDSWDKGRDIYHRLKNSNAPVSHFTRYVDTMGEGMDLFENGKSSEAIRHFKDAATLSDSLLDASRYRISAYASLIHAFMKENNPDSAIHYVHKNIKIAEEQNQVEALMNDYMMLAGCYQAKGDREKELDYRLKHLQIRDSIFSIKEYGKILYFQSACDIDDIERKLEASEYQRKMRETVMWLASGMLLIALISIFWIVKQNRRLKQTIASLYEKAKKAAATGIHKEVSAEGPAVTDDDDTEYTAGIPEPLPDGESVKEADDETEDETGERTRLLDMGKARELKSKIEQFMTSDSPWLSSDFSLQELSKAVGSNSKYVSYVLNRFIGKTFSEYINEFRVMEACRRFSDEQYANMTIETVGKSVGFKSRSNFGPAFKKVTGLNPKDYLAMARNEKKTG